MIRICPHVSLTRAVIRDHLSSELSGAERDGRAIASAALQIAPLDAHQKQKNNNRITLSTRIRIRESAREQIERLDTKTTGKKVKEM